MLEQLTDLGQSVFAGGPQLDLLIEGCASFSLTVLPSLLSDIFLCRASVPQCAANCCKEKERGGGTGWPTSPHPRHVKACVFIAGAAARMNTKWTSRRRAMRLTFAYSPHIIISARLRACQGSSILYDMASSPIPPFLHGIAHWYLGV